MLPEWKSRTVVRSAVSFYFVLTHHVTHAKLCNILWFFSFFSFAFPPCLSGCCVLITSPASILTSFRISPWALEVLLISAFDPVSPSVPWTIPIWDGELHICCPCHLGSGSPSPQRSHFSCICRRNTKSILLPFPASGGCLPSLALAVILTSASIVISPSATLTLLLPS